MKKSRILVADDEQDIRDILRLLLEGEGYEVLTAQNGQEVLECADDSIDLYLLDVNMPVMTGFAAAAELRKKYLAPIIFLTAYGGESDKVMGFSVGADDYIEKPFSNMDVLLRIRAMLRRVQQYTTVQREELKKNEISYKDLILDLESQSVRKQDEIIVLTYTEFKILELLITHRKKVYSLDNIYQSIWQEDAVGDSTIMVHIKISERNWGISQETLNISKLPGERDIMRIKKKAKTEYRKLSAEILELLLVCLVISAFFSAFLYFMSLSIAENYLIGQNVFLSEIQESTLRVWLRSICFFAGVVVFMVLFLVLIGQKISYLITIIKGVDMLRQKNLEYKISVEGNDEFTELAKSINYLSESQRELRHREDQFRKDREALIRALSHDIRTPLTSIVSYSDFMNKKENLTQDKEG